MKLIELILNDVLNEFMSILLLKAFDPLTDEETKDKYEKLGNPDGTKGTAVTIDWSTDLVEA